MKRKQQSFPLQSSVQKKIRGGGSYAMKGMFCVFLCNPFGGLIPSGNTVGGGCNVLCTVMSLLGCVALGIAGNSTVSRWEKLQEGVPPASFPHTRAAKAGPSPLRLLC